ncbi:hypothetical protein HZB00_00720 [Candidatus Woesearchaeota archaeon]|nr:hypothetical protein [Candidatus Woesearchaeota archaeon]
MAQELQQTDTGQDILLDMSSRIRSMEGKYNLLRDRVLIVNQNMVTEYKKTLSEMKAINSDLKEIKMDLFQVKETMRHLVREIDFFARKEDVKVLEKYINLWNPMKFVTEQEVIQILERHEHKKNKEVLHGTKPSV